MNLDAKIYWLAAKKVLCFTCKRIPTD